MTTHEVCDSLNGELSSWRNRLHEVVSKFDVMPSIDKFKLTTQIEGLHILETELNDRIGQLSRECPTGGWHSMEEEGVLGVPGERAGIKASEGAKFDYDFGG